MSIVNSTLHTKKPNQDNLLAFQCTLSISMIADLTFKRLGVKAKIKFGSLFLPNRFFFPDKYFKQQIRSIPIILNNIGPDSCFGAKFYIARLNCHLIFYFLNYLSMTTLNRLEKYQSNRVIN